MPTTKILLVDSVSMFLEIERGFLRRFPVRLLTAGDGGEALALVKKERPNLAIVALELQVVQGDECCRIIKADPVLRRIPVVMVGTQKALDRDRCQKAGCDAFLSKPLDRSSFVREIRRFLPDVDRHDRRLACSAVARVRSRGVVAGGEVRNISRRGIFVAGKCEVAVGDVVELAFQLPNEGTIQAKGQVCWVNSRARRVKPSLPEGFGLEFVAFAADSQQALQRYLENNLPLPSPSS